MFENVVDEINKCACGKYVRILEYNKILYLLHNMIYYAQEFLRIYICFIYNFFSVVSVCDDKRTKTFQTNTNFPDL